MVRCLDLFPSTDLHYTVVWQVHGNLMWELTVGLQEKLWSKSFSLFVNKWGDIVPGIPNRDPGNWGWENESKVIALLFVLQLQIV